MRTRGPLPLLGAFALALATLACTCGPITGIGRVAATLQAVGATAEALGPTLEVQITGFGPRVQAEMTRLAEDVTRRGPEVHATSTAAAATAAALGSVPGAAQTQAARQEAIAATARAIFDEQHQPPPATPVPAAEYIAIGETRTGAIASAGEEHSWLLDAQAGQAVTVEVSSAPGMPPGVYILSPDGHVLYETAGSAEPFVQIVATLPTAGTYIIRVSLAGPGEYAITLRQ